MRVDFQVLKTFYGSSLGQSFVKVVKPHVTRKIRIRNSAVMKLGYMDPFLGPAIYNNNLITGVLPENYIVSKSDPIRDDYLVGQSLSALPAKTGSQNIILTINVIEYADDLSVPLREIWRCLVDGGRLIWITPTIYNVYNLLSDAPLKLAQRFTKQGVIDALERCNFAISSVEDVTYPVQSANALIKALFDKYLFKLTSVLVIEARKSTMLPVFKSGASGDVPIPVLEGS